MAHTSIGTTTSRHSHKLFCYYSGGFSVICLTITEFQKKKKKVPLCNYVTPQPNPNEFLPSQRPKIYILVLHTVTQKIKQKMICQVVPPNCGKVITTRIYYFL